MKIESPFLAWDTVELVMTSQVLLVIDIRYLSQYKDIIDSFDWNIEDSPNENLDKIDKLRGWNPNIQSELLSFIKVEHSFDSISIILDVKDISLFFDDDCDGVNANNTRRIIHSDSGCLLFFDSYYIKEVMRSLEYESIFIFDKLKNQMIFNDMQLIDLEKKINGKYFTIASSWFLKNSELFDLNGSGSYQINEKSIQIKNCI